MGEHDILWHEQQDAAGRVMALQEKINQCIARHGGEATREAIVAGTEEEAWLIGAYLDERDRLAAGGSERGDPRSRMAAFERLIDLIVTREEA